MPGLKGAAVTNPAAVGGAGVTSRSRSSTARSPPATTVHVTPELWDNTTDAGKAVADGGRRPDAPNDWPLGLTIKDWTTYTKDSSSPARARASSPATIATLPVGDAGSAGIPVATLRSPLPADGV